VKGGTARSSGDYDYTCPHGPGEQAEAGAPACRGGGAIRHRTQLERKEGSG